MAKTIAQIHNTELSEVNRKINEHIDEFETGVDLLDLKGNSDFEMEILHNGLYTQNPNEMVSRVDEDEKLKCLIGTSGQNREMWFLTEDGLYEVLMQSRKPIAKAFKKEVKQILKDLKKE